MDQDGVVVVHEDTHEPLKEEELDRHQTEARALEIKVTKKIAELKRAKEEQSLLFELQAMNKMIIKRKENPDISNQNSFKISTETLTTLRTLEDTLKAEEKMTLELKKVSNVVSQQLVDIEKALEGQSSKLVSAKRWARLDVAAKYIPSGDSAAVDFKDRKTTLAELHKKQKMLNDTSDRHTKEIEQLESQLAERTSIEEQIAAAEAELKEKNDEYDSLNLKVLSYERLRKKKERVLDKSRVEDNFRAFRHMDYTKRSLLNYLSKLRESSAHNIKSIISMEMRLRQLEARLEAANSFLKQAFADIKNDPPMTGVANDATEVPLIAFEELSRELVLSRETIVQRDEQLDTYDTKIEELEKKMIVIRKAIASRAVSSELQNQKKELTIGSLMNKANCLSKDFDNECFRLTKENENLRSQLATMHR
ncbi:unnamed protein product [Phytomonas sp. Hart1]|nr:unnamed protein product [Phytomonas sp. Hart1]|eukprot:CCW68239.1 unnamed protein product [Phytomonas sp. isolate Hart1]